jgi:ribosome-associated protein
MASRSPNRPRSETAATKEQIARVTNLEQVECAARAAADKKARAVAVLDVGELLSVTDHFVICSGSSDRLVRTIAEEVIDRLREMGVRPIRREGEQEGGWILLDYGPFVVHVFTDEVRAYYDLERLWKDAPRLDLVGAEEATG